MTEPFPLAPALWIATAPPAPPTPTLEASARADMCVIGAGYAGLSTALALAKRGVQTIVLETREPGWSGSGRNGGQMIPGLKYDSDELEAMFGPERGPRLVDFAGRGADAVFDLIARHAMDVPHARSGWIQGAHSKASVEVVKRRAAQWESRGADVAFLDQAETDRRRWRNTSRAATKPPCRCRSRRCGRCPSTACTRRSPRRSSPGSASSTGTGWREAYCDRANFPNSLRAAAT